MVSWVKSLLFILFSIQVAQAGPLVLKKDDVMAFLGDSNTQAGGYVKAIRAYVKTKYPNLDVQMINAGVGGDTSEKAYQRIEKDIFEKKVSLLFIMFGINDIAWGNDKTAYTRERHFYYMKSIVADSLARGLKVYVLSYPMMNNPEDKASKTPLTGEVTRTPQSYLQLLGNDDMNMAKQLGGSAIDVQGFMRRRIKQQLVRREPARVTIADGVHLNDLGHAWVAEAILFGLGL